METRRLLAGAPPTVLAVQLNADQTDPADLPSGPQPTAWTSQRSQWESMTVYFSQPVQATAHDLVLTGLGIDSHDLLPIAIGEHQLTLQGAELTVRFDDQPPAGVYQLEVLASVRDQQGAPLDGNRDGLGGDSFLLVGNPDNRFFALPADLNGDGGVSVFDFPALSYWFGQPTPPAPAYADLNGDGGISAFDLSYLTGPGIQFPAPANPEAAADAVEVVQDTQQSIFVLHNDRDANGDDLTISNLNTSALRGEATIDATGKFVEYNAADWDSLGAGQVASESFGYTVTDGRGGSASAEVRVSVVGVNDAPQAVADQLSVAEHDDIHLLTKALLANDNDPDQGDALTIVAVDSTATRGALRLDAGLVSYRPAASAWSTLSPGESATDQFSYTVTDGRQTSTASVTVTILGENEPPTILSLDASPSTIVAGDSFTLTADGVHDSDGVVASVSFFRDANRNGSLDAAERSLPVAIVDSSNPAYSVLVPTAELPPGPQTFFAEAVDDQGQTALAAAEARVDPPDDLWLNDFSSEGGQWILEYGGEWSSETRRDFRIGVYQSPDGQTLDRLLGEAYVRDSLDSSSNLRSPVTIQPGFVDLSQDYYLVAVIDDLREVGETNEMNNQLVFQGGVFWSTDGVLHVQGGPLADVIDVSLSRTVDVSFHPRWLVDVDNDDVISVLDAQALQSFLESRSRTPWRNASNPWDVNDDDRIDALDALSIANDINQHGGVRLLPNPPEPPQTAPPYLDVNGDGAVSALDYLRIVNLLNAAPGHWWNQDNPYDVNADGRISDRDLQLVKQFLNRTPPTGDVDPLAPEMLNPEEPLLFYDVDGDDLVSKQDADLIMANLARPALQNPSNPFDVNNHGGATPADAILLQAHLDQFGEHAAVHGAIEEGQAQRFWDVDGDDLVSVADLEWLHQELDLLNNVADPRVWHNPDNAFDVDHDQVVSVDDAEWILDFLGLDPQRFALPQVAAVHVRSHGGDDRLTIGENNSLLPWLETPLVVFGGPGNDNLSGGKGDDLIQGGSGDDLIDGGSGDDWLDGADGSDTLLGGDGDDHLQAGAGSNRLQGGAGRNRLLSMSGADLATDGPRDEISWTGGSPLVSQGFDGAQQAIDLRESLRQAGIAPEGVSFAADNPDPSSLSAEIDHSQGWLWLSRVAEGPLPELTINATHPDAMDPQSNPSGVVAMLQIDWQSKPAPNAQVINGGFETPVVGGGGWQIFAESEIPGWRILQGPADPGPFLEIHRGLFGGAADGVQYVELDADQNGPDGQPPVNDERGSVTIGQTLQTMAGESYELSYDFAPRPGQDANENQLRVVVSDVSGEPNVVLSEQWLVADGTADADNRWRTFAQTFVAAGSQTLISFQDVGQDNTAGTFLDNIWIDKPRVDLDIDADNDGRMTWIDDYLEDEPPGHVVTPQGGLSEVRINVDHQFRFADDAPWLLQLTSGASQGASQGTVQFWDSPARGTALGSPPLTWRPNEAPQSIWMEGMSPGQLSLQLSLFERATDAGRPAAYDVVQAVVRPVTSEDAATSFWVAGPSSATSAQIDPLATDPFSQMGALITSTSDGYFFYDPQSSSQLQSLQSGESVVDSFQFLGADGSLQEVSVAVEGTNAAPVIRPFGDQVILPGDSLQLPIRVTDEEDSFAALTLEVLSGPPGAAINALGWLEWDSAPSTPAGDYPVTIQVTDSGVEPQIAAADFTVTVLPPESQPPQISPVADQFASEGEPFELSIHAADSQQRAIRYSLIGAWPFSQGAEIDEQTGVFRWTPMEGEGGETHTFTVRASAGSETSDYSTVTFPVRVRTVNQPPAFDPIDPQQTRLGEAWTLLLNAVDPDQPAQILTYRLGEDPPAGVNVTSTGVLSWIPPETVAPGRYDITVVVDDNAPLPLTDTATIGVDILPPFPPLVSLSDVASSPAAQGGEINMLAIAAAGPTASIALVSFHVDTNGDGVIDFEEDAYLGEQDRAVDGVYSLSTTTTLPAGDHAVYAVVRDDFGQYGMSLPQLLTIAVAEESPDRPPTFVTPLASQVVAEGQTWELTLEAVDPEGAELVYSLDLAPEGASISRDGALQWTTSEQDGPGDHFLLVRATETSALGGSALLRIDVRVNESNQVPHLAAIPAQLSPEEELFQLKLAAVDEDWPPQTIRYSLAGDYPPEMTLNAETGLLQWLPAEDQGPGYYAITVRAEDDQQLVAQRSFILTIAESNQAPIIHKPQAVTAYANQTLSFPVLATDADLPSQTLAYQLVDLPAELATAAIDPQTGIFTWTPTEQDADRNYEVQVLVTDEFGANDRRTFPLRVHPAGVAPRLEPVDEIRVSEGDLVSLTPTLENAATVAYPLRFRLVDPAPALADAEFDPLSGRFSWQTGELDGGRQFPLEIQIADAFGQTTSQTVSLRVDETNSAPEFSPLEAVVAHPGDSITVRVAAIDPDWPAQDLFYNLVSPGVAGATVDSASGVFHWSPDASHSEGDYAFAIAATDEQGASSQTTVTVRVEEQGPADQEGEPVELELFVHQQYAPGKVIVPWNLGWEEKGQAGGEALADYEHDGYELTDQQIRIASVILTNKNSQELRGLWRLKLNAEDAGKIRVYDQDRREIVFRNGVSGDFRVVVPANALAAPTLRIEGIEVTGKLELTAEFVPDSARIAASSHQVEIAVLGVDLQYAALSEGDEQRVGGFIPENRDFDQGYTLFGDPLPDNERAFLPSETLINVLDDELARARIVLPKAPTWQARWSLEVPPGLRVWDLATRRELKSDFVSAALPMDGRVVELLVSGLDVREEAEQLRVRVQPLDASGAAIDGESNELTDAVNIAVLRNDLQISPMSELQEEHYSAVMAVNDDHDEKNWDFTLDHAVSDIERLTEPTPPGAIPHLLYAARGIQPEDDDLATGYVALNGPGGTVGKWWVEVVDRQIGRAPSQSPLIIWTTGADGLIPVPQSADQAVTYTLLPSSGEQPLWLEGLAERQVTLISHFIPDQQAEATGSSVASADEVDVEIVDIDIQIDSVDEWEEERRGSWILANQDFSKGLRDQAGVPLPDHQFDAQLSRPRFDPQFARDLTPAEIHVGGGLAVGEFSLEFAPNLLVWDVTLPGLPVLLRSSQSYFVSPASQTIYLMIEGLSPGNAALPDAIDLTFTPSSLSHLPASALNDRAKYHVVELNAAFDGNRDQSIDYFDKQDQQLLFWYNNDREIAGRADQVETEDTASSIHDAFDFVIHAARDLEDFAPLRVLVDAQLVEDDARFQINPRGQAAGTFAKVYRQFASGGALPHPYSHVSNQDAARKQVAQDSYRNSIQREGGWLAEETVRAGDNPLLIEFGCRQQVCGPEDLQLEIATEIPMLQRTKRFVRTLDVQLFDISQFYDVFEVSEQGLPPLDDESHRKQAIPNFATYQQMPTRTQMGDRHINDLPGFDSQEYVVFLHGWNMTDEGKEAFGDTIYKRLYWQGFQGRFGLFNWPGLADANGPLSGALAPVNLTFNPSDLNAYRSGRVFKQFLHDLNHQPAWSRFAGNIHILAHSQGNVVVGEALRLWAAQYGPTAAAKTYIAMDAALSAGAYGADGSDLSPSLIRGEVDFYRSWPDGNTPFLIGDQPYFAGSQTAAQQWVSLHLPTDVALDAWRANNIAKNYLSLLTAPAGGTLWPFRYHKADSGQLRRLRLDPDWVGRRTTIRVAGLSFTVTLPSPNGPDVYLRTLHHLDPNGAWGPDAYEILAFIAVSMSGPLGKNFAAGPLIQQRWTQIDVNHLGLNGLPHSAGVVNHSFLFQYAAADNWRYWQTVKEKIGFLTAAARS